MLNDNPLVLSVLATLKEANNSIDLYQLMLILEEQGYDLSNCDSDESYEMKIFRKNFVVMNALYQIKSDLIGSGSDLIISSLKILLVPLNTDNGNNLSVESGDKALSDYYLNWDNYDSANDKTVGDLLSSFWTCFTEYNHRHHEYDKRLDSLQVLGLKSSASWEDVQQAYRQLIMQYHPDKGGDSLKFINIREAYLILKFTLTTSH